MLHCNYMVITVLELIDGLYDWNEYVLYVITLVATNDWQCHI